MNHAAALSAAARLAEPVPSCYYASTSAEAAAVAANDAVMARYNRSKIQQLRAQQPAHVGNTRRAGGCAPPVDTTQPRRGDGGGACGQPPEGCRGAAGPAEHLSPAQGSAQVSTQVSTQGGAGGAELLRQRGVSLAWLGRPVAVQLSTVEGPGQRRASVWSVAPSSAPAATAEVSEWLQGTAAAGQTQQGRLSRKKGKGRSRRHKGSSGQGEAGEGGAAGAAVAEGRSPGHPAPASAPPGHSAEAGGAAQPLWPPAVALGGEVAEAVPHTALLRELALQAAAGGWLQGACEGACRGGGGGAAHALGGSAGGGGAAGGAAHVPAQHPARGRPLHAGRRRRAAAVGHSGRFPAARGRLPRRPHLPPPLHARCAF